MIFDMQYGVFFKTPFAARGFVALLVYEYYCTQGVKNKSWRIRNPLP